MTQDEKWMAMYNEVKSFKDLEDHQISFEAHTESETFIIKEGNLNRQ